MPDHVVDTNVLLVASAAHPYSPFDDSGLPPEAQAAVFEWLVAFRADESRLLVWDGLWKIYQEYRNKLTDQDFGLQVVREKMASARWVDVDYEDDGDTARVPAAFAAFDPSDRKLLAAVLNDGGRSSLVNASDTDWLEIEGALRDAQVVVEHLLEGWLRAKFASKKGR